VWYPLCRLLLPPADCLFPAPFTLIFTFTPTGLAVGG
jgi:hypothetical protein